MIKEVRLSIELLDSMFSLYDGKSLFIELLEATKEVALMAQRSCADDEDLIIYYENIIDEVEDIIITVKD